MQRTVLAFHDRSLAVDGKVQVVQPFVILDDIVQVAFLRDGHVLHNVQDVLAWNHFGAVVVPLMVTVISCSTSLPCSSRTR